MENKIIIEGTLFKISEGVKENARSVNQKIPVNSFEVKATNESGTLTAAPHMKYLLKGNGSAPGKMRPVEKILDWIISEGITPTPRENKDGSFSKVSQQGMAWAISISQSVKGSLIYQGKKQGVDLNSVLKKEIPTMLEALAKNTAVQVATAMRTGLATILVLLCFSCSPKIHGVQNNPKIRKNHIATGQMFLMVGSFMLGYGLTNEYLIKE